MKKFNMNLKKNYFKKKILITGHTGFKGVWLTKFLEKFDAELYGISLKNSPNDLLFKKIKKYLKIKSFYFDIHDDKKLNLTIKKIKPEIIFHFAAQSIVLTSFKDEKKTFDTNVIGTINLIKSLNNLKSLKKIFFITTDKVYDVRKNSDKFSENDCLYGNDPYSLSKVISDLSSQYYSKFLKKKKIQCFTIRAGNVFGGGDFGKYRLVNDFFKKKKLLIRNPNSTRPFQFILDTIYKYLLIGCIRERNFNHCIWNIAPNKSLKVSKVLSLFNKGINKKIYIKKINIKETNLLEISNKKFLKKFGGNFETNFEKNVILSKNIYANFNNKSILVNEEIEKQIKNYLNKIKSNF